VTDAAISLDGVSKRYVKYDDAPMLTSALRLRSRTKRSVLEAVTDLDLRVDEGETVGVLGRNGAGKSTLLQMLCGITAPSTGRVRVRGRVAPLISVGVGFHPELTGRENVYVNGTVLGMSRRELDRRFDEVVAFAELEDFIDTPVKFYSSGMFVRLGFSVAVAADPDVLLVDEVLAVGDFAFQIKCYKRMEEIRAQGTTIVMVSHNVEAIRGLCARGIVMQRGHKIFDGPVHEAVSAYYSAVGQTPDDEVALAIDGAPAEATMIIESFELLDPRGRSTAHVQTGDDAIFRLRVQALAAVERPCLGIVVTSEKDGPVYADTNLMSPFASLAAGERAAFEVHVTMPLAKGGFSARTSVHRVLDNNASEALVQGPSLGFYVAGRPFVHGVVDLGGAFRDVRG
jgi:ABC-type polysaccharide/polyol phosphate transport system ATPase subunit